MTTVDASIVAVYVYRRSASGDREYLQLRRASGDSCAAAWAVVYGGIEPGETAVQAALRELEEETGLRPVFLQQVEFLESFYFRAQDRVVLCPVFVAEVEQDSAVRLDEEHDAFRWVARSRVRECFMWRTQRECLAVVEEQLDHAGEAAAFLTVLDERNASFASASLPDGLSMALGEVVVQDEPMVEHDG